MSTKQILLRSEFSISNATPVTQDHLYSINAVPRKIYELTLHWQKDHSQFLPLSQRPWPAAPRTPRCSSSWCPCTARAAVQMPSCPGLQMIILIRMLRCRKSNKKVCKIVLKRHPKVVFVFVFVFQRCVKLFLHATLTLSFAATVAALSRKLTFSIKRVFSGLETWVRGWQEPARQSTRLVSPERLKCRPFVKFSRKNLVDSLFVPSISTHFLENNQGARFDEVHPVGPIALQ